MKDNQEIDFAAAPAEEQPVAPDPALLERLLGECLKPDEISGSKRAARVRELLSWFRRFADGNANPKWFRAHAFELAYALAAAPTPQAEAAEVPEMIAPDAVWAILYDDYDVRPEILTTEAVARERFRRISDNWNAHLFVKVASNSRDDRWANSNAMVAAAQPAAAPVDALLPPICYSTLYLFADEKGIDYNDLCVAVRAALSLPQAAAQAAAEEKKHG